MRQDLHRISYTSEKKKCTKGKIISHQSRDENGCIFALRLFKRNAFRSSFFSLHFYVSFKLTWSLENSKQINTSRTQVSKLKSHFKKYMYVYTQAPRLVCEHEVRLFFRVFFLCVNKAHLMLYQNRSALHTCEYKSLRCSSCLMVNIYFQELRLLRTWTGSDTSYFLYSCIQKFAFYFHQ